MIPVAPHIGAYDYLRTAFGTDPRTATSLPLGEWAGNAHTLEIDGRFGVSKVARQATGRVNDATIEVVSIAVPAAGTAGKLFSVGRAAFGRLAAGAAESRLVGGTFDVGATGSQYTLRAPTISGFEGATGTVNTRAFVVHGNSAASPRTAYLYELYQADGTFLKNGITQNMDTRYTKAFMEDKYMIEIASGPRRDMLSLERQRTLANPGPLNKEPWAIKARNGQ